MKSISYKLLLYIFLLLVSSRICGLQAQQATTDEKNEEVYKVVGQMPEFPGGRDELRKFLKDSIRYPVNNECVSGRVILRFTVEKDGSITDVKVAKSMDSIFDAEAVRVVKLMPKWIPSKKNGLNSSSEFTLPVTFQSNEKKCKSEIYKVVEQMPKFPGGLEAMREFINENLKYPEGAGCVEGKVILQFTVEKDGSLSDIKVARSLEPTFDAEAIRVIKLMPKWIPGEMRGKPVRIEYMLPVSFKLSTSDILSIENDTIYTKLDEMPSFPEGKKALMEFVHNNLQYPSMIGCGDIQGKVIIKFIVEKNGSLSDIKVARSLEPSFDAEATRVVKLMPKWNPGKKNGIDVRTYYTLPITFLISR